MKMKTLLIGLTVFSLLALSGTSFAADTGHKKAAVELMTAMDLDTMLKATIEKMLELEIKNNTVLQPFKEIMREFFEKYMSAESLGEEFISLYVDTFTEKELSELTAFYKTPTGMKALKVTPDLMAKGAAIGQKRIQDNIDELKQMIAEEAQRIQQLQEKQ